MKYFPAKVLQIGSYLRFLKIKSVLNYAQLICSYYLSMWLRMPIIWGKPQFLSIEPVNFCNLRCPECPTGNGSLLRKPQAIQIDLVTKLIDEIKPYISYLNFYFQGEPFMHPHILSAIAHAHRSRIYTSTSTNGQFITAELAEKIVGSGLQKIIVSLDGYDQQSYQAYRKGGSFSITLEAIGHISSAKKKAKTRFPLIEAQVLLLASTENHLHDIEQMAVQSGADYVTFKTAQFYDLQNRTTLLPSSAKSRYAKNRSGLLNIKGKPTGRCWRMWSNPVVCSDGSIVPCCYDKNAEHAFGSLDAGTLASGWKNAMRKKFIALFMHNRASIAMCKNCPEGRR